MSQESGSVFVISYSPMLKTDKLFLSHPNQLESITKQIAAATVAIYGCAWMMEEDGLPSANLFVKNAKKVADHLIEWAEFKPEERFKFAHLQKGGLYSVCLMPDIDKSVLRVRDNYLRIHGKELPQDCKYQVVFNPITFVSNGATAYQAVLPNFKDKVRFSLVEFNDSLQKLSQDDLMEVIRTDRNILGDFTIDTMDVATGYMTQAMEEGSK